MSTQKKSLKEMIEIITLAIPREIDARRSYMAAAEKAVSDRSRNLFFSLAEQEKGHEAVLRDLLRDLRRELDELS